MLYFKIFEPYKNVIKHGVSTRHGGVSSGHLASLNLGIKVGDSVENLRKNYEKFLGEAGISVDKLILANQDHTDNILGVKKENSEVWKDKMGLENVLSGNFFSELDGFITNIAGLGLTVRFADCQGVLLFEPEKKVIAAVHSGWRGNVKNIIGKTVRKMVEEFGADPAKILVGISPSLGPCCAEFTDPKNELPEFMHKYLKGMFMNLWQCSFDQLTEEGVLPKNIEIARRCTVCENKEFFSFRASDKKTGHMGGAICLI